MRVALLLPDPDLSRGPPEAALIVAPNRSRFNCYKPCKRVRLYAGGVRNTPPERPESPECVMGNECVRIWGAVPTMLRDACAGSSRTPFGALDQPRFAIPLPAFAVVGGVYLLAGDVVRHRARERQNATAARLGLIVLVLNQIWNLAFSGARSTAMRFVGCLVFAVPLAALQTAVRDDRVATLALAPYTVWVLAYDVPWSYRL